VSDPPQHGPASLRTLRANDLDVELTVPAGASNGIAILVPGLLATSQFFRVDADAGKSLARFLNEDLGLSVVHYDARGLGRNRDRRRAPIDFASRVADLAAVLDAVCRAFRGAPVFMLGHSFGGTTIYALLAGGEQRPRAVVTMGSPARLVPRPPPWERLFTPATSAMVKAVADGDWIDLPTFSFLQNKIYSGGDNWPWLPLWLVRAGHSLTRHSTLFARLTVAGRKVASIAYRADPRPPERDYSARELRALLQAGALERESAMLLQQLLSWGQASGAIALPDSRSLAAAAAVAQTPVLAAFSQSDELVLPEEVTAWSGPAAIAIDVGSCGHGGYFFKPATRAVLVPNLEAFLGQHG
jgi:pimeloyl-ACP methyl ester carboxylesterase